MLYLVPTLGSSSYRKRIVACSSRKRELDTDPEMRRMPPGAPAHIVDPSAIPQRVVDREAERVGDEAQCVEKLLFPDPLGPTRNASCAGDTSHAAMLL